MIHCFARSWVNRARVRWTTGPEPLDGTGCSVPVKGAARRGASAFGSPGPGRCNPKAGAAIRAGGQAAWSTWVGQAMSSR